MEQEQSLPSGERVRIVRGADNQLAALERLWIQGEGVDPHADDLAWQTLRQALNESRRAVGAPILYGDE